MFSVCAQEKNFISLDFVYRLKVTTALVGKTGKKPVDLYATDLVSLRFLSPETFNKRLEALLPIVLCA